MCSPGSENIDPRRIVGENLKTGGSTGIAEIKQYTDDFTVVGDGFHHAVHWHFALNPGLGGECHAHDFYLGVGPEGVGEGPGGYCYVSAGGRLGNAAQVKGLERFFIKALGHGQGRAVNGLDLAVFIFDFDPENVYVVNAAGVVNIFHAFDQHLAAGLGIFVHTVIFPVSSRRFPCPQ